MGGWLAGGWLAGKPQGVLGTLGVCAPTYAYQCVLICAASTSWPCSPETRQKLSASRKVGRRLCTFPSTQFSVFNRRNSFWWRAASPAAPFNAAAAICHALRTAYYLLHALDCAHLCAPRIPSAGHSGAARRLFSGVAQCPVGSCIPPALEPGRAIPHELLPPQHEVGSVSSAALAEQQSRAMCISEQFQSCSSQRLCPCSSENQRPAWQYGLPTPDRSQVPACHPNSCPCLPCSPEARANVSAGQRRRRERERAQREAAGAAGHLPGSTAQPPAWLNEGLARERAVIELSRLRRELAAWLPVRAVGRGLHGLRARMAGAHSQMGLARRTWRHEEGHIFTRPISIAITVCRSSRRSMAGCPSPKWSAPILPCMQNTSASW